MNQVLKDSVYGMGTMKHVEFLARLGGMNEEEYVSKNYSPDNMTRCKLEELYKISDIMKDMSEYWKNKMDAGLVD